MFNYIIIFGTAAITYLVINKLTDYTEKKWYIVIMEFLVYAMINMVTTFLCLNPFGRVSLATLTNGTRDLQYGNTAVLFSILVAIIWGLIFSCIKKNIEISIEVSENKSK